MSNTQKVIRLFKSRNCSPCEALHTDLSDIIRGYNGIHIEVVWCDDGGEGSDEAMERHITTVPHMIISDHISGRRSKAFLEDKIERLCGHGR